MAVISQREARRLQKRVKELETQECNRRNAWAQDYPGGVHLTTITGIDPAALAMVMTARKLKHAVVVTSGSDGIRCFALPLARLVG